MYVIISSKIERSEIVMQKFFYLILISLNLVGLEIKILPDKNLTINNQEIEYIIKNFLQKKYIKINKKVAQKYIKDNRILSDKFLKEYTIPQDLVISLRLNLEENLANLYVKKKQKNMRISEEILKSYYKTHPKLFQKDQNIHFTAYKFKSFEDALKFYQTHKIASKNALIEKKDVVLKKSQIHPLIAPLFDKIRENETTPPVFYGNAYIVFEIKRKEPQKPLSFEESKEKIRSILLQKIFLRTKKELVEK